MADVAPPVPTSSEIESVLAQVEKLSHWERRLFFKKLSHDRFPRFFYKFFPFDTENTKSVRNLHDVVVESRFWLSDHERFNDPFDLKANVVFDGTPAERERRLKELIANQNPYARRKERREILVRMMKRSPSDWGAALNEIFRKRTKDAGVCSFATDFKPPLGSHGGDSTAARAALRLGPRSILMWAHYGRNHAGVSLQFETVLSPRVFTYVQEVEYNDKYPRVNYTNLQKSIMVPFVRKHKGWEYEKEWRFVHMTGVRRYLPFEPHALRRLIVGCRASPDVYAAVESLLSERQGKGHPPVDLFRAVQHPTEYKLLLWCIKTRQVT